MAFTFSQIVGKFLRYGQNVCVYPGAFEEDKGSEHAYPIPQETETVQLTTSDRETLECFYLPARSSSRNNTSEPRTTVIVFHGNGCHIWHHLPCGVLFTRMGCNALMLSYRGYGNSTGLPSEKGLQIDAQAALDYVTSHPKLSKTNVVLHGHSLGGAVAIDLAYRNPTKISALIIENTFTSIIDIARDIPFINHFTWIVNQKWHSATKMSQIPRSLPICMLSGSLDIVVPPKHMSALWDIAQSRGDLTEETKDMQAVFPDGGHSDTWSKRGYRSKIRDFLTACSLIPVR